MFNFLGFLLSSYTLGNGSIHIIRALKYNSQGFCNSLIFPNIAGCEELVHV